MNDLAQRIADVKENIALAAKRSGRSTAGLVAVTKTVPAEVIAQAIELGLTTFGENRVQEALPKAALFPQAKWHFIGRLQTNKAKDVVGTFSLIHSLDRWKLAQVLQREAEKKELTVRALLQVNIGREPQKGGLVPEQVVEFMKEASTLSHVRIEGLMAVPPVGADPEDSRPYFREMYQLYRKLDTIEHIQMKILSMGMSGDYTVAVEEGANLVRVGSLLFGERT